MINRSVNANNLNRHNSVHRSVGYNNVQVNNNRANRMTNANNGRPGNGAWNNGNNGRAGNSRVNNGNNARPGDRPLNTGYNARANNTPSGSGRGNRPGDPAGNYGSSNSQPAGNDRPPPQPTRASTATSIAAIRASSSTAAATTMPAMAVRPLRRSGPCLGRLNAWTTAPFPSRLKRTSKTSQRRSARLRNHR